MKSTMFERVLVVLEEGVSGERGVTWVRELTRGAGHVVHLLVVQPRATSISVAGRAVAFTDQLEDGARASGLAYLERVAARLCEDGLTVTTQVRIGSPANTIRAAAQNIAADLVVVSCPAARGRRRLFDTSLASRILGILPVPVLMVGPACRRSA